VYVYSIPVSYVGREASLEDVITAMKTLEDNGSEFNDQAVAGKESNLDASNGLTPGRSIGCLGDGCP
jgi:hypothetical protein